MKKQITLNTSKINYFLKRGEFHKEWYEHEKEKLITILPEFEGLPILRCFAVTSMTSSIESNTYLAIKALLQIKRNECFHGFLPTQITYLNLIKEGKDVPGRKIMNFIKALEGDKDAVVVDIWMCKAFDVLEERKLYINGRKRDYFKAPNSSTYTKIETYCKEDSIRLQIEPRQYQSMLWAGIKTEEGVTRNVSWSDLLIKKRGFFPFINFKAETQSESK